MTRASESGDRGVAEVGVVVGVVFCVILWYFLASCLNNLQKQNFTFISSHSAQLRTTYCMPQQ
ncbi:hypothetical protein GBAR_LOCUS18880, partial [Geodia barretti]